MLSISSGPSTVISSGMVTSFFGYPLTLNLDLAGSRYAVTLQFVSDDGELRVHSEPSANALAVTLYNFTEPDGRGSSRPVLIGELAGNVYFFHFRCFRFGITDDHTVHYTFFEVPSESPILGLEGTASPG